MKHNERTWKDTKTLVEVFELNLEREAKARMKGRKKTERRRGRRGRKLPRADTKRKRMVSKTGGTKKGRCCEKLSSGTIYEHPSFVQRVMKISSCVFQIGRQPTTHDEEQQPRIDGTWVVATRRGA